MTGKKILTAVQVEELLDDKGDIIGQIVTDFQGNLVKVKKGQGGKLEKRWGELVAGKTYEFMMDEFKGYPFVSDFHEVATIPFTAHGEEEQSRPQTINASIESQVAVKAITELWIADKLSDTSVEVEMCRQWLRFRFPWPDSDIPKTTPQANPLVNAAIEMGAVVVGGKDKEFKNAGDFLMQAFKVFKYTKTEVLKLLEKNSIEEVKDLTGAWVFLQTMKEKEDEKNVTKKSEQETITKSA